MLDKQTDPAFSPDDTAENVNQTQNDALPQTPDNSFDDMSSMFEDDIPYADDTSTQEFPDVFEMFTCPTDFSGMKDGDMVAVKPEQLIDFPMGNARRKRNPKIDAEILESMRQRWIIQPVVARPSPDGSCLELLGGYGRRDKAQLINDEQTDESRRLLVPVLVRVVDDAEAYAIHLAENTQRENLSLIEESLAAQLYITNYAGDKQSAATQLGWTMTKLNERLELCMCTEKVKDALENARISASHAILLAPFPDDVQDLQVDNIVNNGITVRRLREIVGKVQLPIEQAKFDTSECQSCPHNNAPQLGLFGGTETNAKCAKATCYQEKTTTWLSEQRKQAEDRYGKVLFLSQTSKDGRNTISAKAVGEEQFQNGCSTCQSNVVVMNDSAGREGLLMEDQCIDKPCFNKLSTQFKHPESVIPSSIDKSSTEQGSLSNTTVNTSKQNNSGITPTAPKKAVVSALPNTVIESHKKLLRKASAEHLLQDVKFQLAVNLASIIHTGNFSDNTFKSSNSFEKNLIAAMSLEQTEIQQYTLKAITFLATSATSIAGTSNVNDVLINALKTNKQSATEVATKAWEFTSTHLEGYTIRHLIALAKQSGIDKEVEQAKSGAWVKLKNGSKSELLKRICETKGDHASFAPPEFLQHVTK